MDTSTISLSLDATKIQGNAVSKMLEMTDLTPETLAKVFKDVGESPEKLRALLNLWFTPWHKPNFAADHDYSVAGLRDVEFLGTADLPPGQLPYRMFDIETGNLVEYPAIGVRGQYCMLSHRWKGVEVSLGYIKEARRKELERAREAARDGQPGVRNSRKSDMELVMEQCRLDIEEQEGLIKELLGEATGQEAAPVNIAELLDRRLNVRTTEYMLGKAKDKEDQATTKLRFARMEQKIFSDLVKEMHDRVDEEMEAHLGKAEAKNTSVRQPRRAKLGGEVVTEAETEVTAAADNLKTAEDEHGSVRHDIEYFQQHFHLRDALDELVCRLQRWKSVIKIDRAIQEADRIFKTKLFRDREKCYLWTDPCCIDKSNGGELSESLSLMGDWYADAEYTLVQLDTPFREADAVTDWRRFEAERGGECEPINEKPNILDFRNVKEYKPEWSTRAWTLQELVMSKTTFYVNSEWSPLSRPVESLGYFYYLIPFIALYTGSDTKNIYRSLCPTARGFWDSEILKGVLSNAESSGQLEQLHKNIQAGGPSTKGVEFSEISRVETAQQLIALLDVLGVRIHSSLTMETATSEVARAVYLASANLTSESEKGKKRREHYLRLKKCLPEPDLTVFSAKMSEEEVAEEVAQHALNFVLQCLVAETEDLILVDRQCIAEFGKLQQLTAWQRGTSRAGFSAQSVLELSGTRTATVATDKSYALMGILDVRFPTFPAEGSIKALARLLDEVVITRNDISVFNWIGMEMGSPIRGRSMYPSSPAAYGKEIDRGKRYNLLLAARVQDKMDDVVATYHSVIRTLRTTIDFLKDKERKSLPINWIERIVQIVRLNGFRELRPQQEGFEKIVAYVREYCRRESLEQAKAKAAKLAESAASPGTAKGSSLLKRPAMPSVPSLSTPSLSLSGLMSSAAPKKEEEGSTSAKKPSKFGLGKGLKSSSFGFSKKGGSSAQDEEPAVVEVAATPPVETSDATLDPPPPYAAVETPSTQLSWQDFDGQVMDYLTGAATQRLDKVLPPELQSIKFEVDESERLAAHRLKVPKDSLEGESLDTISPNPIIVNNSGIEGLFDIQRVVVTMIDAKKLRRQVAKAVGPHDKISGWCSISTGFARVITNFACERHILEQELDVIESVDARVLREEGKDKDEKRSTKILSTLSVTNATASQPDKHGVQNQGSQADAGNPKATEEPDVPKNTDKGNTEEERLVGRMIDFIQEPQLALVAGEWVLARFSGAPGANWFLCHLELGPVPGQFYGRRIAAGAIDFRDSTPEPGLVSAWQTYMDRKKRKMCYILDDYLRSRMTARSGGEKLKEGSSLAQQGLDMASKGLRSPGLKKGSNEVAAGTEGDGKEGGDESDDEGVENLVDKVLGQGRLAVKVLGEYTVLAVAEKLFEMRADHLDKTLAAAVLKRTPKALRTAVENMNDNKSFLPAMFHSSTRVHMF
ncbi:uncharacterized protein B0H64DRAFT_403112 [Chaetomium fimeti]|uniref:Heterokaryon incompatibility domain-containing protein n=1 Tax=Chaetomium fimeti TaxID=1854472 RepID=A0AAE0HAE5_9PEZI|nr:hypothetical protein B0H64DRAFT_403112 [Chaetomium fimeti]